MFADPASFVTHIVRLGVWLGLLAVVLVPLERWMTLRSTTLPPRQLWTDVGLYFLNSIVPAAVLGVLFGAVATAARAILPPAATGALDALPTALRLMLAFVIAETGFYWGHRLSHAVPWLWRFHAVHHAPEHLYFLVNTHAHPVDVVVIRLFGMLPLYALGLADAGAAGSGIPAAVIVLGTAWGFLIHSDVRLRLGPLELLIATPAFHHWHHTGIAPLDRNFASTFPVLDRVFGTHYLPRHWPTRYGLAEVEPD